MPVYKRFFANKQNILNWIAYAALKSVSQLHHRHSCFNCILLSLNENYHVSEEIFYSSYNKCEIYSISTVIFLLIVKQIIL